MPSTPHARPHTMPPAPVPACLPLPSSGHLDGLDSWVDLALVLEWCVVLAWLLPLLYLVSLHLRLSLFPSAFVTEKVVQECPSWHQLTGGGRKGCVGEVSHVVLGIRVSHVSCSPCRSHLSSTAAGFPGGGPCGAVVPVSMSSPSAKMSQTLPLLPFTGTADWVCPWPLWASCFLLCAAWDPHGVDVLCSTHKPSPGGGERGAGWL